MSSIWQSCDSQQLECWHATQHVGCSVVDWSTARRFPHPALSQCKVGNNQYLLLQRSKRTVCVPMSSFTQIQLLFLFWYNSSVSQLFYIATPAAVLFHCYVIVALSSNCHHCFVLIQRCCVTFASSNNHCHHHFVLIQLCCVTVTLIGDISIFISWEYGSTGSHLGYCQVGKFNTTRYAFWK